VDRTTSTARIAAGIFGCVFAFLFWFQGNRFVLTNDEGILLEPARQMAAGARPYVDFFGYMSPGSYWIQAALFKLLGVSLWVGRLPVLLGMSLQCALVFWLTARLASRRAAWAVTVVFLGFQIADPSLLTAQHRWDSAALALAGLSLAVAAEEGVSWGAWAVSGALLAAAAWCTPSMALVGVVEIAWLLASAQRRGKCVPVLCGMAVVTALAIAALAAAGSLHPFLEQMLWLRKNYATVNVMSYGSVIGGYAALFVGTSGAEAALRGLLVVCLALPAILAPLGFLLWGWLFGHSAVPAELKPAALLLLPAAVALAVSAFPRADVTHLAFVAALPYVLVAAGFARVLSLRAGAIVAFTAIPFAILFSLNSLGSWFATLPLQTAVGRIRVEPRLAPEVAKLVAAVGPGQTLYIHPYMPVNYFVTQAENPTRFSFLAPGMMTRGEEAQALRQLEARAPEWVLYMTLTRDEFLRVFPNAGGLQNRFSALEKWLEKNYTPVEGAGAVNIGGYRLMRRSDQSGGRPVIARVSRR